VQRFLLKCVGAAGCWGFLLVLWGLEITLSVKEPKIACRNLLRHAGVSTIFLPACRSYIRPKHARTLPRTTSVVSFSNWE
jgi:hypothetical protein